MTAEEIKEFKTFLTKKRLWSEFKRTYFKIGNAPSESIDTTFKSIGKYGAVLGVITWNLSERGYYEGIALWETIHKEWQEVN